MQLVDVLAIVLVVAAAAAFVLGESALARAEDLMRSTGSPSVSSSLRAAVQVARPGKTA